MFRRKKLAAMAITAALAAAAPALGGFTAAHADGPGSGTPWIVSVGDSYISGEAGRWAGNTDDPNWSRIDAGGPTDYFDSPDGQSELIDRCHRSKSAEVFIGAGVNAVNFACSGAGTGTSWANNNQDFKPGVDFYVGGPRVGQAWMLRDFARTHNVRMISLSIGGNNFKFGDVVQACLSDWATSPSLAQVHCSDDPTVAGNFTPSSASARTNEIAGAIRNIHTAMADDGYADSSYTILVQDYLSPVPAATGFRYPESGWTRQNIGGCGFWDADANWMNNTALAVVSGAVRNAVSQVNLPNVRFLELSGALNGHRLCESGVGLLEEKGLASWKSPGASDQTEWINQIRTGSTAGPSPYYIQESLHPNHWGQLALRNCLRQAWNGGSPMAGRCTPTVGGKSNSFSEPNMTFARQVVVPSVVGQPYATAQTAVTASGLTATKKTLYVECGVETTDQVTAQTPAGGTKAYAGDSVLLTVKAQKVSCVY